jgi:hypothetical protein
MKLVAFDVNGNEREVKKAYVDGYDFGDRMLEDVIFEITIVKGKIKAQVTPDSADYFSDLNEKKWLKTIEEGIDEDHTMFVNPNVTEDQDEVYLRRK